MKQLYYGTLAILGIGFAVFFFATIGPAFLANPNFIGACKAGFVNVYSSGFATDAVMCWFVLAAWIIYDKSKNGIKYGWIALLLGLIPGVATGFAFYLFTRARQTT
ncbi:MAG: DUF2834 domain-containing protein [Flavobacteriales bacterium]